MLAPDFLHPLLRRQLDQYFGGTDSFPPAWEPFLRAVNEAYIQADLNREGVAQSLTRPAQELATASQRAAYTLQQNLRETMLVNRVLAAVSTMRNVNAVLQRIMVEIAEALALPQGGIGILNDAQDRLTIVAAHQPPGKPSALGMLIPVEYNLATQRVLYERKPFAIADARQDEQLGFVRQVMLARGVTSMLLVPLVVRDRVIGTLGLDSYVPHEFTPAEISLVQNVATAVGQALDNAQLYGDLEQERAYLLLANHIGRSLAAQMSFNGVWEAALMLAPRLGAEFGYVLVLENDEPISFKSNFPLRADWDDAQRLDLAKRLLAQGVEQWALQTRETAVVFDTHSDPRWYVCPSPAKPRFNSSSRPGCRSFPPM